MGSVASLNITITEPTEEKTRPKFMDRGYAWVIMIAVFAMFLFSALFSSISTLIYQQFLVRFDLSAATASWILSLPSSIRFLASPLIALLYQKLSYRVVAMTGVILQTLGLLLYGFATGLWMLYAGSVSIGVGGCMLMMSSFIIVPMYFSRKRSMAMSFVLCGHDTGAMFYPQLVTQGFSTIGYTQTMIFLAGGVLQIMVTSALYRPQPVDDKPVDTDNEPKPKLINLLKIFGVNLLGRPILLLFMMFIASIHCLIIGVALFLSGLAIEVADMTPNEIALALSIGAFCGFLKLPFGMCLDLPRLKLYRTYIFCSGNIVFTLFAIAMAITSNSVSFTVFYTLYLAVLSCTYSQYITVLGDMVTIKELQNAIALTRTVSGISLLIVPPAIGRIKDIWDSFQYGIILMSLLHIVIVIVFVLVYFCWNKKNSKAEKVNGEHE